MYFFGSHQVFKVFFSINIISALPPGGAFVNFFWVTHTIKRANASHMADGGGEACAWGGHA